MFIELETIENGKVLLNLTQILFVTPTALKEYFITLNDSERTHLIISAEEYQKLEKVLLKED